MIERRRRKTKQEPTIGLINIVFLILIFFMVAGTLSKAPDDSIEYVSNGDLECCAPADALIVSREGALSYNGESFVSVAQFIASQGRGEDGLRVMPDRDLPADRLVQTFQQLRGAGAGKIILVVEQE